MNWLFIWFKSSQMTQVTALLGKRRRETLSLLPLNYDATHEVTFSVMTVYAYAIFFPLCWKASHLDMMPRGKQ